MNDAARSPIAVLLEEIYASGLDAVGDRLKGALDAQCAVWRGDDLETFSENHLCEKHCADLKGEP